jgi:glycosyltransferase involved in cell wall biosynthesis
MRITFVNQFYPPDLAPTGRLAAALAEHRAAAGDHVTVVTGRGAYVPGTVTRTPPVDSNPRVLRFWTPGFGKGSFAGRLIDYGWFYLAAAARLMLLPRQDVVISLTTPPFIAWASVLHRWLHPSARLILWSMDSYPEALTQAGLIPEDGWLARLLRWQQRLLFRRLELVVCPDQAMQKLLSGRYGGGAGAPRFSVVPNWESAGRFRTDAVSNWSLRREFGLGAQLLVLHVGNAGYGHAFETVAEAAGLLRQDPVAFVFVGGGVRWRWLEKAKQARGLANWHLRPYLPEDQLKAALAEAGCALITLRDSFLGVISPSKLHAALAMGLPILYHGPEGSNVDEAIGRFGCGVSLRHGDAQAAAEFLRRLGKDASFAAGLAQRARAAFESAYTDERSLPSFDRLLEG